MILIFQIIAAILICDLLRWLFSHCPNIWIRFYHHYSYPHYKPDPRGCQYGAELTGKHWHQYHFFQIFINNRESFTAHSALKLKDKP